MKKSQLRSIIRESIKEFLEGGKKGLDGKKIGSIDIGYTNEIYDSGRPELSENYKLFVFNEEQTPITFIIKNRKLKSIFLLGGLDYRGGDLSIEKQVELVKKGLSSSMSIKGFRYNDYNGILNAINESEQEMYVILFSAGASKSKEIAKIFKQKGYNLKYIFIVEPYAKSENTSSSVRDAVNMGVPSKNVFVGNSKAAGMGVVENTSNTPNCSPRHWCSLTEVAKIII